MDDEGMKKFLLKVLDKQGYESFIKHLYLFAKRDFKDLTK